MTKKPISRPTPDELNALLAEVKVRFPAPAKAIMAMVNVLGWMIVHGAKPGHLEDLTDDTVDEFRKVVDHFIANPTPEGRLQ